MSKHNVSEIPTPMDAVKQIYEIFQDSTRFLKRDWAKSPRDIKVTANDAHVCCWCLASAVFRVYNLDVDTVYWIKGLPKNIMDTFKLLWEKLPPYSKFHELNTPIGNYINDIIEFNDIYGYKEVMRLLKAVIDDTEYMQEV